MPTLETIAETEILLRSGTGIKGQFVPFNEELTAQCLASQLDCGTITLADAYNSIWSYVDIENERKRIPAWDRIVHSVSRQVKNPDKFVRDLAVVDPGLAAKCVGDDEFIGQQTIEQVLIMVSRKMRLSTGLDYFNLMNAVGDIDPCLESFVPFDENMISKLRALLEKFRKRGFSLFDKNQQRECREIPHSPLISSMSALDIAPNIVKLPFELYTFYETSEESFFCVPIDEFIHPTFGASAIVQFAQKYPLNIASYDAPSKLIDDPRSILQILMKISDLGPIAKFSLKIPNTKQKEALNDLLDTFRSKYFTPCVHTIYVTQDLDANTPPKMFKLGLEMAKKSGLKELIAAMRLLSYAGTKDDIPEIKHAMLTAPSASLSYLRNAIQLIKKKYEPKGYSLCQS